MFCTLLINQDNPLFLPLAISLILIYSYSKSLHINSNLLFLLPLKSLTNYHLIFIKKFEYNTFNINSIVNNVFQRSQSRSLKQRELIFLEITIALGRNLKNQRQFLSEDFFVGLHSKFLTNVFLTSVKR